MHFKRLLGYLGVLTFTLSLPHVAAAQLAGRSATDWTKVLDTDTRVASLKIDETVAKLQLKPGESIADIGAGSGLFEVQLAKAVSPGGKVYAEDIDEGFFPEIKKKAEEGHVSNVVTVLGKYTDPNLPVKNLDVIFIHDVLHHIENPSGYLKTAIGYLKGSGRVVVIDYEAGQGPHKDQPDLQISREQLAMLAKDAGLKQVEDVKMFSNMYFLVYSK
ncbi:MAG: methyltransferase domain-containing protein [Acidobacteriia bacterium]|nr:methyltransferase domain-containing protein [Terriglobia bacterium]